MAATILQRTEPVYLCINYDPCMWDPGNERNDKARKICRRCPSRTTCPTTFPDTTSLVGGYDHNPVAAANADTPLAEHHTTITELLRARADDTTIAARLGCSEFAVTRYRRTYLSGVRPSGRRSPKPGAPRSRYRGVSWRPGTGRWRAVIGVNGRKHHLGSYATEVEAARAYDRKAAALGRHERMNFPPADVHDLAA